MLTFPAPKLKPVARSARLIGFHCLSQAQKRQVQSPTAVKRISSARNQEICQAGTHLETFNKNVCWEFVAQQKLTSRSVPTIHTEVHSAVIHFSGKLQHNC